MQGHVRRPKIGGAVDGGRLLRSTVIGIAAGLSASWIMDRFQVAVSAASGSEAGEEDEPATAKAADAVSKAATGEPVPDECEAPAGSAVHYGFGALVGGLYGALGEILPGIRAGFGTAYGAGVAVVADEALVPAVGLAPPPQEVPVPHMPTGSSRTSFSARRSRGRGASSNDWPVTIHV